MYLYTTRDNFDLGVKIFFFFPLTSYPTRSFMPGTYFILVTADYDKMHGLKSNQVDIFKWKLNTVFFFFCFQVKRRRQSSCSSFLREIAKEKKTVEKMAFK